MGGPWPGPGWSPDPASPTGHSRVSRPPAVSNPWNLKKSCPEWYFKANYGFYYYYHFEIMATDRVMTLCHQLFCREIFRHGENRGRAGSSRRQQFGHFTVSTRNLLPTSCLALQKQAGNSSSRGNVVSCFISVMSVGPVIRAGAGNLSLPRTSPSISCHRGTLSLSWCLGQKYSSLVSISQSRSSGQIPW